MKRTIPQMQYGRLLGLFHKLNARLNRHFTFGRFYELSKANQAKLINRLAKLKAQLQHLEKGMKLAGSALAIGAALYSGDAQAQFVAAGTEFRVNTTTATVQATSAMAMDSDGDFVVTWASIQDGSGYGIYAQRYNALGVAQGSEIRVNTYTAGNQLQPSVAMDSDGDFVVTWSSYLQDGSEFGVYAQRYNATGVAQGSEFQVNTYTTISQKDPSVAMDSDGDFVVTWQSTGQDGSNYGVYGKRYDASGIAQGIEFRVNTYTTGSQAQPSVAMDNDGDFVVTWQSLSQDGSSYGVYGQRYNATGVAQGIEFKVNTSTAGSQIYPSLAIDSDGDFVVAWQDNAQTDIYAQRYNATGVAQGTEFKVNTITTGNQENPAIAIDSDGDFVVTWQSIIGGSSVGIYAQRYNALGVVQGAEFQANTYVTNYQYNPSITMDSDGDFVVSWQSYGQDGSSYGIYAQRYTYNTPPVISAQTFSVAENSALTTVVGTVVASDADAGQTLTYSITAGNTGSVFAINSSTGEITVTGALDFETTNSYALTVQIADNGTPTKSASAVVTVDITDINENAPVISDQTFSVAENSALTTVVGTVVASDADPGQTLTYSITAGNTGSVFAINSSTGEITVAGALDFETTSSYALTVDVSDNGTPVRNSSAVVTINITDVVETTGIATGSEFTLFVLYPNPAQDQVFVNLEGEVNVKLLNLSGQLLKEAPLSNGSFSVAGLQAGVYLVEIEKDGQKAMKKLVVK